MGLETHGDQGLKDCLRLPGKLGAGARVTNNVRDSFGL